MQSDDSWLPGSVARWLRASLAVALILALAGQAAQAGNPPVTTLNPGINDAWFNAATPGQGFFVVVHPEIEQVFLAWFTYDTDRPPEDVQAMLGEPGHRWVTAQGPYQGNTATLTVFVTEGGVFDAAEPAPTTDPAGDGTITLEFADCTQGMLTYEIDSLGISGEIPIQRVAPDNIALCEALLDTAPECTRPEPDLSHGPDDPPVTDGSIIPQSEVFDTGVGPDGIPPVSPKFTDNQGATNLTGSDLVVGVKVDDDVRAYPHRIMNWHEVANTVIVEDGNTRAAILSYCPLTGTAMLWRSPAETGDVSFGTSGLVYNSNLIMYDRATRSFWSQMLEQSVAGSRLLAIPQRIQVVETTWQTWRSMYPQTLVMTEDTGFSRDYNEYPYGSYRQDQSLLYPVDNMDDGRLHRKARVLGINVGAASKVWPVANFAGEVEVINDTVGDMQVVVAGSSGHDFGVVYNRQLEDCTVLSFEAVQDSLPVVMRDNEGNEWDIFGTAVSGTRAGQQLQKTNSYISFWFAWTAFFPGADIHR